MGLFKELWEDARDGDVLAVVIIACTSFVLALCAWLLYTVADTLNLSHSEADALVIEKQHRPGHYQTILISNGKTTTPHLTWIHEAHYASVQYNGHNLLCAVSPERYYQLELSTVVRVVLTNGRLSGKIRCRSLVGDH